MSSSLPPHQNDADLFSYAAELNNDGPSKPARRAGKIPNPTRSQPSPYDLVDDRLLTDRVVADLFSVSRQTVWRWARSNDLFPKPVQVSPGASRWRLTDIRSFMTSLREETHKEGVK